MNYIVMWLICEKCIEPQCLRLYKIINNSFRVPISLHVPMDRSGF